MENIRKLNETMKKLNLQKKLMMLGLALGLTACSGGNKPNVELIQDMMDSPAIKAQEYDQDAPGHRGMRVPPEHTVPVGFKPYRFATDYEGAINNVNPLTGDFSSEVLVTGQKYFDIHCAVCHGEKGDGKSPVTEKMTLKPPTLYSDKVKTWKDGQIYHVIQVGQGLMGPYASHIPKEEWRWAVVQYIRHLQKETK
jgi:mono/diheme cytochrome c family protein